MSHGIRIYPDQFYQSPNVPAASWWETVDATLAAGLNGDGGGVWTPTGTIFITGSQGMICGGPWTLAGGASCVASGSQSMVLGDSDYLQLAVGHTARARSLVTPCGELIDVSDLSSQVNASGASATTTTLAATGSPRILLPLRVHNGAGFSSIVFSFVVAAHANVPTMPQFRVYQMDAFGNITWLNTSGVGGYLPFTPTPSSGPNWRAGGATQTFTYTPNATFIVDTSQYAYFAEIVDESGANAVAGNVYLAVTCNFLNIVDTRPQ